MRMRTKKTLMLIKCKMEITGESIYDNFRGSSLSFEFMTEVLQRKVYRFKYHDINSVLSIWGGKGDCCTLYSLCKGLHHVVV